MNNSNPVQYGARQEEPRSSIPALQRVIAACNFVTAVRLAISGYEYSTRGYYFVPWMKFWVFFQCLLPSPDILLRFFGPRDFSAAAIHRTGFLICAVAVLMTALGIALLLSRRWVLLAELVVCLLAIAGRFFGLAELMKPPNARPPHDLYSWLYFLGLIPALVFAFYSWRRFRQPLPIPGKGTAGEYAAQTNWQEMPTSTFFLSLFAVFFYSAATGISATHMDYWPKRYMLMHTVLVGGAYLAVMVFASVPRLRLYAGPVGIGVAIASFSALGLRGTLDPFLALVNLGFALGALINGEPAAMFLCGFVLSNILLAGAAARHVKWSRPETIFILLGAAICAAGTGPLTNGIESHEEALANTVREQAGLVPARMYTVQKCLLQYARANSRGSYPGSLRELNTDIPGCMNPAVASGETVDGFRYKFDSSEDHAGIHRFHLLADSIHSTGKSHVALFSDESFVLRKTDDVNYAPEKSRAYVPTTKFTLFLGSIQNHTHLERERLYWEKNHAALPPETLGSSDLHYPETLVDSQAPGYFPTSEKQHDDNSFADDSYVYSYEKTAGPPENFRLEMRPARYGVTGLLSFFVDNTGIVRATPEDRPATPQDPPAYVCAYDVYSPDCAVPVMTGPVDLDNLFPKGRQQPPEEAFHPGGLAKDATPKLFWRINDGMPKFLGISEDARLLYVTNVLTGISALRTSDGSVAWTLPGGANGVAGGDGLYTLSSDGLLMRIDSTGRIVWRFSAVGAKELVRARNGTLFVPGGYLWAVNENGGQVWRMQPAEFGAGFPALSPDEKTL